MYVTLCAITSYADHHIDLDTKELNVHGTFNITRAFLQQLPHPTHCTIISLTTALGAQAMPAISSYTLTKLVVIQMMACVAAEAAAEQRNVTAVGLDPGMVNTDLMDPKVRGSMEIIVATLHLNFAISKYI